MAQFLCICNGHHLQGEPVQFYRDLDLLLTIYILKTLEYLQTVDYTTLDAHLKCYIDWMAEQRERLETGESRFTIRECQDAMANDDFVNGLHTQLESANKEGLFFSTVCRGLIKVLTQKINAEDHLRGRLVIEYCQEMVSSPIRSVLYWLFSRAMHPRLRAHSWLNALESTWTFWAIRTPS